MKNTVEKHSKYFLGQEMKVNIPRMSCVYLMQGKGHFASAVFLLKNSCTSECYLLTCVELFTTPWSVVHQPPLSMEFSRQEYWSGLPFSSVGDLPTPGIKAQSPALQVDSLLSEPSARPPQKP